MGWYPAPGGGSSVRRASSPYDDEEMVAAMTKTLVVVESPTKAKTLERYLGPEYTVRASIGDVRDLTKGKLAVDTEREFEPEYVVPNDSEKHVRALRAALKKADDLVLATDFDREGEAIAYHVAEVLKVDPAAAKRVTFTEITRDAILEAFQSPRAIDLRLVEAQQARRILDRLVGYRLSPVLWKKVRPGLSAGRVQSVALRLIVDRDREIPAFVPGEGRVGLITYMRTDSTTMAESALREIAEVVKTEFGAAYALKQPRRYKTKQRGAQEAHEAIRPTSAMRTPDRVAGALDKGQLALYRLIWQRTVASQMAEARFDQVSVDVEAVAG